MTSNFSKQETDNKILLSIVIPTLGTRDKLELLLNDIQEQLVNSSFIKSRIEVLLFINNESQDIFNKWQAVCSSHIGTKIVQADQHKISAEQSAFHAATQASGKYVWWIGDDDDILPHAIDSIFQSLISHEPSYILFNCLIETQSKLSKYYSLPYTECSMKGLDLYQKLGFISATTTLSCLCINRELINIEEFEIFHNISPVYSHSTYLSTVLFDKKVLAVDYAVVCKKESTNEEIEESFKKLYQSLGKNFYYPFTEGLIKLLEKVAKITRQDFSELLNFQEVEFSKTENVLCYSTTGAFIKSFYQISGQKIPHYLEHFSTDKVIHSGNSLQIIPDKEYDSLLRDKQILSKELEDTKNRIKTILNSKSWFITKPLRYLNRKLQAILD